MDQFHRKLIRENYIPLTEVLKTAIEDVCTQIWTENLISERMKDTILEKANPRKQAEALLDLIVSRGPDAFDSLYKVALNHELYVMADIMRPDLKPHHKVVENRDALDQGQQASGGQ
uniref:CARD domain-containing protein n=1 Tax=Arion vulgaris TaxID=1028688 RepID=A0A0B7BJE2_9EUPU